FEHLPREEQGQIMLDHARIGMRFGDAGFVQDIRLACHGIDRNDNDFVLGLIGKELFPLSRIVQEMRKTQQTALHMESLGPFFVGRALWQSPFSE
ncbi:MAG TPA: chlorite dismutase family protein, partial [Elusimicrobiota bacterium]|nr:chlorite dismutase family protein [Elusimicrobiota bacterium]